MFYFGILLLFVILGILRRKSKIILICLYAILFFVSVNFTEGYDLKNYENGYNKPIIDVDDVVMYRSFYFATIISLLKLFDISFFQFRILCFFLWSISIYAFALKFSKYPTWVIALCSFFPLLTFSSQMRNGFAISIVYLAFYILFSTNKTKGKYVFTVLVVLAGLIHDISYFYLFGIIALGTKIKTGSLICFCLCFNFIFISLYSSGFLYWLVSHTLGSYYADMYFVRSDGLSISGLLRIICIFINLRFSFFVEKFERLHRTNNSFFWTFSRFVLRLNVLLLSTIPLLFVSMAFYRIFQNMFVLTAITVANASSHYFVKGVDHRRFLRCAYLAFYICLTSLYHLIEGTFLEFFGSIKL